MMSDTPSTKPVRRAVADALLGLVLFLTFAFGLLGASGLGSTAASDANAAEMARVAAFTGPLSVPSSLETVAAKPAINVSVHNPVAADRTTMVVVLAVAFAVLFSFNLAFFRHIRRVYAQPSRKKVLRF